MSGGETTETPAPPAIEPRTEAAPAPAPATSTGGAIATGANTVATATARTPQPPQTKAPSDAFKEFFMTVVVPFLTGILGRVASYIMGPADLPRSC